MRRRLKQFDDLFIELINNKIKNKFLDTFMYRITDLGGAIATSLYSLIILVFGNYKFKLIGVESLMVLGISQTIVQLTKLLYGRERPYNSMENLNTFNIQLRDYSFPSGHTTASFSIATTLALNIPILSFLVFTLAFLIGISRIYLAVHYPTDVVVGILLGVSSSVFVHIYLIDYVIQIAALIGI